MVKTEVSRRLKNALRGPVAAMATPFNEDLSLGLEGLRATKATGNTGRASSIFPTRWLCQADTCDRSSWILARTTGRAWTIVQEDWAQQESTVNTSIECFHGLGAALPGRWLAGTRITTGKRAAPMFTFPRDY